VVMSKRLRDAHKHNCCTIYCKWSEPDCPVVNGTEKHDVCPYCIDDLAKRVKEWCKNRRSTVSDPDCGNHHR